MEVISVEYSVRDLSRISGVTARTLRYYDEIGLLKPARISHSGYRIYDRDQVDMLQQILLHRELGFSLNDIKSILYDPDFDVALAFEQHLAALKEQRAGLDALIANVTKSISALKGESVMSDEQKFEGFGRSLVHQNEEKYGAEARRKYGDDEVDSANRKIAGMTREQYDASEDLRMKMEDLLKSAFEQGDPACDAAQQACDLHRQWLCVFYPKYTREYHLGLAEMYVCDDRFRANYDKLGAGCTEFLRDAIRIYCG